MVGKQRLDILLVERGYFPSREKARSAIMAGLVKVGDKLVDKAGAEIPSHSEIYVAGPAIPYVSRGGLKLEKAIREFGIDLTEKVVVDIGASTGGFTDCMLQHGARKVYAVDVGYGQLDWKLRQDSRVVNLERTNFRYFNESCLGERPDIVTIDVSFISLNKILPKVHEIAGSDTQVIALIKPQFEAGREKVGKKGVVRDKNVHIEVVKKIIQTASEMEFNLVNFTPSPIKGPEGNIEYLAHFIKNGVPCDKDIDEIFENIEKTVKNAFNPSTQEK